MDEKPREKLSLVTNFCQKVKEALKYMNGTPRTLMQKEEKMLLRKSLL